MDLSEIISQRFSNQFGSAPSIMVRSPGRVNLIGEHTDYNEGFVLPAAVDKEILFGISPNKSSVCRLFSIDKEQFFKTDVSANRLESSDMGWPNYILGVVDQLKKAGYKVPGFDLAFGGTIPIGAGMSSSAALEGGTIYGLSKIFDWDISRLDMVKKSQKAENEFVGVNCGIMDQFANIFSEAGKVFQLDCRSLEYEYYPFVRDDLKIVLCDTTVRRELATSEYNVRRSQCEEGVSILQKYDEAINSLRDVTLDLLAKHQSEFDPVVYKRCEYVVEENIRVQRACEYLEKEDFGSFGKAMYQSHAGLKDKYEVSSPELDALVDIAKDIDGVLGARMMGAGFGGCTINLVEAKHSELFTSQIQEAYEKESGVKIPVYQSTIAPGVGLV